MYCHTPSSIYSHTDTFVWLPHCRSTINSIRWITIDPFIVGQKMASTVKSNQSHVCDAFLALRASTQVVSVALRHDCHTKRTNVLQARLTVLSHLEHSPSATLLTEEKKSPPTAPPPAPSPLACSWKLSVWRTLGEQNTASWERRRWKEAARVAPRVIHHLRLKSARVLAERWQQGEWHGWRGAGGGYI